MCLQAVTKTTPLPGRSSGSASRGSLQAASAAKTSSDGAEGDAEDSGDAKGEDGLGHVDDIGEDALVYGLNICFYNLLTPCM